MLRITIGYLRGNLGDIDPETYEDSLYEALRAAYEYAEIRILAENGEGSPPARLRALVTGSRHDSAIESEANLIADRVFERLIGNR